MEESLESGAPQGGLDIEGQIKSGVEAFMQSQDPAIAVEVVTMLAEMMGIAPEVDPYAGQEDPMAVAPGTAAPAAANGMRLYARGGKIKYKNGGKPKPKGVTSSLTAPKTTTSTVFSPQDMNSGTVQSRVTDNRLVTSLREAPAKGSKRQQIQAAAASGQPIAPLGGYMIGDRVAYDYGRRKGELAGQMKPINFEVPGFEHTLPPLDIPEYPATSIPPPPIVPPRTGETPQKKKAAKLKPMAVTLGGSDRRGNPANKFGIGRTSGTSIRRTKSFPKYRN